MSKPEGTITLILTTGQRNEMMMVTFSLLQRWEFTTSILIYNSDNDPTTDEGYSTSLYGKYMFYENKAKTGGFAVKVGTGLNKLSVDVMPGFDARLEFEEDEETVWQFT